MVKDVLVDEMEAKGVVCSGSFYESTSMARALIAVTEPRPSERDVAPPSERLLKGTSSRLQFSFMSRNGFSTNSIAGCRKKRTVENIISLVRGVPLLHRAFKARLDRCSRNVVTVARSVTVAVLFWR
jgi:hypothetical protein